MYSSYSITLLSVILSTFRTVGWLTI